jgi:diguanylate cyclase (GGDEF)-like protein
MKRLRRDAWALATLAVVVGALVAAVLVVRAGDASKDALRQAQVALAAAPGALNGAFATPQPLLAGEPLDATDVPEDAELRAQLTRAMAALERFWPTPATRALRAEAALLDSDLAEIMSLIVRDHVDAASEVDDRYAEPLAGSLSAAIGTVNGALDRQIKTAKRTSEEATFGVVAITGVLAAVLLIGLAAMRRRAIAIEIERRVARDTEERLRHLAFHDPLTGLPNRLLAFDRAEQMLARARRHDHPVAALYVDVDGFKRVNDTYGHSAGDELLCGVAGRLAAIVREGDTAGRLGGDEFVVLLEGSTLDAGPEPVAERLLQSLHRPYELSGDFGPLSVTASIGIATGVRDSAQQLLHEADLALYRAKATGRDRYVVFRSAAPLLPSGGARVS